MCLTWHKLTYFHHCHATFAFLVVSPDEQQSILSRLVNMKIILSNAILWSEVMLFDKCNMFWQHTIELLISTEEIFILISMQTICASFNCRRLKFHHMIKVCISDKNICWGPNLGKHICEMMDKQHSRVQLLWLPLFISDYMKMVCHFLIALHKQG